MCEITQVKSLYNREPYKEWTTVSKILAAGLQGVEVKRIYTINISKADEDKAEKYIKELKKRYNEEL